MPILFTNPALYRLFSNDIIKQKPLENTMDENKLNTPDTSPEEKPAGSGAPGQSGGKKSLRNLILNCISIALVLFAAIIVLRQYVYLPGQYEAPPTPAVTETPVATPEPTPYIKKIPVMMYFSDREISFPVETVGIVPYTDSKGREVKAEDGSTVYTMGTVDSEKVAAWLDASASPGEYGNAIFNGHVSWKKVAGVFSVLPKMEEGEEIIVEYDDGSTMTFTVTNVDIYGIDDVPETVMAYDTGDSRMTLITCYGESWNSGLGTRNQRCVVVAKPVDSSKIITPPAVTPNPDEDCDT